MLRILAYSCDGRISFQRHNGLMNADSFHAEVVSQYSEAVNPSLAKLMNFAGFGTELRGEGCYLYDHEGRKFLDFLGSYGVFNLGHRHPVVVDAVKAQLDKMPLSSKVFFNPVQAELASLLADLAPAGLDFTFFSNSGTEAVEAALKFAKGTTGRSKFVATDGGYHGKTLGALSVTGREKYRKQFGPLIPGASFVPFGDTDRMLAEIDHTTAAVIIEIIQGEGGIHVSPPGYMSAIRAKTREVGALMIVDEVQTGMGRTGKMFACEHEGIEPDILTLAKALGGGVMPIGATMGTEQVWTAIFGENPLMHTSTFGGNPMACAAGIAAIKVTLAEGLCDRATILGSELMRQLEEVKRDQPDMIAEVRGMGLMIGVEFTQDEVGELVIGQMTKRGMIAAYTLNNPRVIRFEPPLIITSGEIETAVQIFREAVAETSELLAMLA